MKKHKEEYNENSFKIIELKNLVNRIYTQFDMEIPKVTTSQSESQKITLNEPTTYRDLKQKRT